MLAKPDTIDARNNMEMQVEHGLPARRFVELPDYRAIGVEGRDDGFCDLLDNGDDLGQFVGIGIDQVARRDGWRVLCAGGTDVESCRYSGSYRGLRDSRAASVCHCTGAAGTNCRCRVAGGKNVSAPPSV